MFPCSTLIERTNHHTDTWVCYKRFFFGSPPAEKNPVVFRRKREEGGLLDYAEETHAVKRFLDKIHPIRDESCPPKSGFSYR